MQISTQIICLRGSPKYVLVSKINSMSPSPTMVILASRGTGENRFIFGSTCDYLLHNLNIPVLVLPDLELKKKSGWCKCKK